MKIIQSKLLKNYTNIIHGFTTKDSGKSVAPYSSLNLAFHVGDNTNAVHENHILLAQELLYKKESLVHMKQIHSNRVHIVTKEDDFSNPKECDALITDMKNTPLMVMVADCSPILFFDSKKEIIGVAHAGRAGTFSNIIKNVTQKFIEDFNSNVRDIKVTIGASIGVCCYEVGEEIYKEAKELNLLYAVEIREHSYYLNIRKILKEQLLSLGFKEQNIEISKECSACLNKKYFSYRAEGVTGRFAGVISLR